MSNPSAARPYAAGTAPGDSAEGRSDSVPWPFTGRDTEVRVFARAWRSARCRGTVILGAAGVGKSRLAQECAALTALEGWARGYALATEAAAGIPLGAVAHLVPAALDLAEPARAFAATARTGGRRLFVVDDLHLLDTTSAVLLRQLLREGVIRLIATVRTGEALPDAVRALTSEPGMTRLDLAVLTPADTEALLRAALGGPVARHASAVLHHESGGNVLYLRELVRGARESGQLKRHKGIWELTADRPTATLRLTELVGSRLATVESGAQPLLDLLALCEPLPLTDAHAVAGPTTARRLESAGLVRSATDGRRTTLSLAHPLYGEVLRRSMPALRRRALLHDQADRAQAHGARRREDALRIASWRLAATGTADQGLLLTAAAQARHAGDYEQAAVLSGTAWRQEPGAEAALSHATALIGLARHAEADRILSEALPRATAADRRALDEARIDNMILRGRLPAAERVLGRRRDTAGRLSLAAVHYFRGRFAQSLADCRPLLEHPDAAVRLDAGVFAASGLLRLGRLDDAGRVLAPLRAAPARPAGGGRLPLYADFVDDLEVYRLVLAGDLPAAVSLATHRHDEAVACQDAGMALRRATALGFALCEQGRPRTALGILNSVAVRSGHWRLFTQWAHANAAVCAAATGDADTAGSYLALLPEPGDDIESCGNRIARAWCALLGLDRARAGALLREAAEQAGGLGQHLHQVWVVHTMGRLGMPELAAPYWDVPVQGDFLNARLTHTRSLATGDPDGLEQAAGAFKAAGAHLFTAEAYADLAALHHRAGHSGKAREAAGRARAQAAGCEGANTPALGHLATTGTAVPMTDRERETALLAVSGLSSKQIAARLGLSVRTVDNHLQRIYGKLGVRGRRELPSALGLN